MYDIYYFDQINKQKLRSEDGSKEVVGKNDKNFYF